MSKSSTQRIAILGTSIQDLAADAAAMQSNLKADLINQFDLAKLAASGADQDVTNLARDVTHLGTSAAQKHTDMVRLYNDLIAAKLSSKDAAAMIETMTGQIFKIPKSHRTDIYAVIHGSGSVISKIQAANITKLERLTFHAAGGRVPGYGGGDKNIIAVEGGETIFPKHLTKVVAPIARAYGLPGFSAGGVAGDLRSVVPFGAGQEKALGSMAAGAFMTTVGSAFRQVASQVLAGMPGPASGGGFTKWQPGIGVGQWRGDVLAALSMLNLPAFDVLDALFQMMTESGGNPKHRQ